MNLNGRAPLAGLLEAGPGPSGRGGLERMTAAVTLRGCGDCGRLQLAPDPPAGSPGVVLSCGRCSSELERTHGRSVRLAFAFSASTLLLLIPANGFPFIRTWVLGASRESHLSSSVGGDDGRRLA